MSRFIWNRGECRKIDLSVPSLLAVKAYGEGGWEQEWQPGDAETVICCPPGEAAELYLVRVQTESYEPIGKYSVDYLSKEVFRRFIKSTHEKYKEHFEEDFGGVIKGIFMDEPRFANAFPWTETLEEEFQMRKGYSCTLNLPLLWHRCERAILFRYDYYDVISDLFAEATFGEIYQWCTDHRLLSTGHLLGEETLAAQTYFGGDMVRCYQYLHVPAIDHLGNGAGSLNGKFAVSAAYNYGKNRIACEAFGASGWDITYEELVRISNWLFQQGINLIMMHGFYYSIRGKRFNDYPPSYFYQWRYWDQMEEYVGMANRMMKLLSGGMAEQEILVYSPIESFWGSFQPDLSVKTGFWREGPQIRDEHAAFIDCQMQLLCNSLSDHNLDYNILGEDAVRNFTVEGDQIVHKLTRAKYRILILPCVELVAADMAELIRRFMEQGGIVVNYHSSFRYLVDKRGEHWRKKLNNPIVSKNMLRAENIEDVIDICRKRLKLPFAIRCGISRMSRSVSSYPAKIIDPYVHNGERVYGIGVYRYLRGGERILDLTNYNDQEEIIRIWVEAAAAPEVWWPETGLIQKALDCHCDGAGYELELIIPANRAVFLVCPLSCREAHQNTVRNTGQNTAGNEDMHTDRKKRKEEEYDSAEGKTVLFG